VVILLEQNYCKNIILLYSSIFNGEIGGRTYFADKFKVSERSISSYIKYLSEELNVVMHYDSKLKRYFIEDEGIFESCK